MKNDFAAAILPETFTVLGLRLQPFSIGHALYLQRFDCAPVDSYTRLITAVLVCSRPVPDIARTMDDPWLRWKLRWWGWRLGTFDIPAKLKLFNEYVRAHSSSPQVADNESFGSLPGAPWLQHIRTTLIHHGWPPDYVLAMPYGAALWDYYTHWENAGRLEILGDEFYEMHALANQFQARVDASRRPPPATN